MTSIREAVRQFFTSAQALPAGTYHFEAPQDDPRNYKLHLRLEPNGNGILIVNAHTVLHLNQTAAEFAYHIIQSTPRDKVARLIANRYKVNRSQAENDFLDFSAKLDRLVTQPDLDPELSFNFGRINPYSEKLSAPLRLDCALTYRLSGGSDPSFAPLDRVKQELKMEQWKMILENAWKIGIPHVIFTGGEPTLRDDLIDLIMQAELIGQVTGLLTDGLRFNDEQYRKAILKTGLDHILFMLQPENDLSWQALGALMKEDIFVVAHITITEADQEKIPSWLDRISSLHVTAISLSASTKSHEDALQKFWKQATDRNLKLVWDIPVPYGVNNPVTLETQPDNPPSGAGHAWFYIEPDGDILAAQGMPKVLGNMLDPNWESILKK